MTKAPIDLEKLKYLMEIHRQPKARGTFAVDPKKAGDLCLEMVPDLIELLEEAQEMFDFQVTVGVTSKRVNEWRNRFEKKEGEK